MFGSGAERERLTIGLWMGDQSNESRVEWSRRVNPPVVWERLQAELNISQEIWERAHSHGNADRSQIS